MSARLQRVVGLPGAVTLGLGSILGTGIFVSVGLAAGSAGPAVLLAIVFATGISTCNAINVSQLAAAHPVSGGTYEYGYRYAHPTVGFVAGWMFLLAKGASAATAGIGLAGYLLGATGGATDLPLGMVSAGVVLAMTALVLGGIRRSLVATGIMVAITLVALMGVALAGVDQARAADFLPFAPGGAPGVLEATAFMFVALAGYGRIATLAEEMRDPEVMIPRAVLTTLAIGAVLYLLVAAGAIAVVGATDLESAARTTGAPLEIAAQRIGGLMPAVITVGAVTALGGVLLNLLLGLSRVVLAMGRRGDLPGAFARVDRRGTTPSLAVLAVGLPVAAAAWTGDVRVTWSFAAFSLLVYYGLTNLVALRLPREERRFHRAWGVAGLGATGFVAFWVEPRIWVTGVLAVLIGLAWHWSRHRARAGAEP